MGPQYGSLIPFRKSRSLVLFFPHFSSVLQYLSTTIIEAHSQFWNSYLSPLRSLAIWIQNSIPDMGDMLDMAVGRLTFFLDVSSSPLSVRKWIFEAARSISNDEQIGQSESSTFEPWQHYSWMDRSVYIVAVLHSPTSVSTFPKYKCSRGGSLDCQTPTDHLCLDSQSPKTWT